MTRRWRAPVGIRSRVLLWFLSLLTVALVGIVVGIRTVLVNRVDAAIDRELVQEVDEFRQAVANVEGDEVRLSEVFIDFLGRTVTGPGEVIVTFIDGRGYAVSAGASPDLAREPSVVALADVAVSERTVIDTARGRAEALAVSVNDGGEANGALVVLIFPEQRLNDIDEAMLVSSALAAVTLLLAGAGAWLASGRTTRPLRDLNAMASAIDETDLSQRIESTGTGEVRQLSLTFNGMLDRLEGAFANQERLLADIGHELRTPLAVVQGHIDVMGDDPHERKATVELVSEELDRMNRLVNDLLLLVRLDQPGSLHLEQIDLLDIATDLVARVNGLADRRWSVDVTDDGTLVADRQRLVQAMVNLITNAIDHTVAEGAISIGARWRADRCALWVHDDGPGVPPSERDRIFERFARGDGGGSRRGSGLGLSIVSAIATAHGGSVNLDATALGARFVLELPTDGPTVAGPRSTEPGRTG